MNNKKELIKKLLNDSLTSDEQNQLLEHRAVSSQMHTQWNKASVMNAISNPQTEIRIWKKIQKQTLDKKQGHLSISFYKIYSIAVSILLLFGVGMAGLYSLSDQPSSYMYVVNTGLRNMRSITLPDGTQVKMGPGSTLTYPQEFSGSQRLIKLNGQAFFTVAHNEKQPFIVSTDKMNVTALGTSFEIFNYTGGGPVETILVEGKVKVDLVSPNATQTKTAYLIPNQKLSVSPRDSQIIVENIDAKRYSAWHTCEGLSFENESICNIIPRLEQWYGKRIECKGVNLSDYLFTFKVRDEPIEDILYLMSQSARFKYKKENEKYTLSLK